MVRSQCVRLCEPARRPWRPGSRPPRAGMMAPRRSRPSRASWSWTPGPRRTCPASTSTSPATRSAPCGWTGAWRTRRGRARSWSSRRGGRSRNHRGHLEHHAGGSGDAHHGVVRDPVRLVYRVPAQLLASESATLTPSKLRDSGCNSGAGVAPRRLLPRGSRPSDRCRARDASGAPPRAPLALLVSPAAASASRAPKYVPRALVGRYGLCEAC